MSDNININFEDKFKELFELNKRLYDIVTSALEQMNARGLRDTEVNLYEVVLLSMVVKIRKHFKAAQELCKLGFGEEAGLVVRSMVNTLIDLTYIMQCGKEELSERFVRYDWIIKKCKIKIIEILDRFKKSSNNDKTKSEDWGKRKKEIFAEVKKFRKKYESKGREKDWSGFSIREKAEKAGKDMELLYHTVYRYNSDIDHGNASALNKYIHDTIPGKIEFLSEPSEAHVEENLQESFSVFIRIAKIFCEQFNLQGLSKEVEEQLVKDFRPLYKRS